MRSPKDGAVMWRHVERGLVQDVRATKDLVALTAGPNADATASVVVLNRANGEEMRRYPLKNDLGARFVVDSVGPQTIVLSASYNPAILAALRVTLRLSPDRANVVASEETKVPEWKALKTITAGEHFVQVSRSNGAITAKLSNGSVRIALAFDPQGHPLDHLLVSFRSERGSWEAASKSAINQIAHSGGKLFLAREGEDAGSVECIDVATGQPQWIYAFPMTQDIASTNSMMMAVDPPAPRNGAAGPWRRTYPRGLETTRTVPVTFDPQ
jgi:hypothetical protein